MIRQLLFYFFIRKEEKSNNKQQIIRLKETMKNKKRGQGLVEYVMLLLIPVLLISFIPNLNKTMKMTMTTVGVDLLEEMGDVEWSIPDEVACPDDDPNCSGTQLYPPVARFELPENCGITGVYGKGRPVRLANASYDIDGDIDHLQWWIKRYDVDGHLDANCTTPQNAPIIVNRTDLTNIDAGLTISGSGYGNAIMYGQRQCTRDPGSYEVTLRVIDNDGLVSQPYTLRYEIRDVRPSLTIMATSDSVSTGEYCDPHPENDDYCGGSGQIAQIRDSDSCKFYPTEKLRPTDKSIDYNNSGGKGTIIYNGHSYPYLEICPYVAGSYTGEVIFKIHNAKTTITQTGTHQTTTTTASWAHADPDYIAINGMDYAFEGENNPDKDRHGFKYKTRYISSVQTEGGTIDPDTVQITTFETGANTYTKQFRTPGTYIYDGFVYDENEVSAFDSTVTPNAGVAIRVISQADPEYNKKCPPPPSEGGTCPKPKYMLAIEKFGGDKEGVIYTSVGVFGNNENNSKITATGNYSLSNVENWFKPVNGTAITSDNYSNNINDLRRQAANLLDLEIYSATKQINGQNTEIAGLAPKTADRLVFHTLVYWGNNVDRYPEEGSEYTALKECIPDESGNDSQYLYWSSSSSYPNNFSLSTMKEESSSAFTDWNGPGSWARIYRPYEDNSITSTFNGSNINQMAAIPAGFATFKDVNGQTVLGDHADVLVGMVRNHYGIKYSDTNLAPNPYNANPTELYTFDEDWHRSSAIEENAYPENGYLRSNAQVIAVIPKNEMCPLHEQRPIPNLSIYAYEVDEHGNLSPDKVAVLLEEDLDILVDTDGMGKFNMGRKQYKIPCESGGCFVQITSIDSACGTGAVADCKLIGTRWKFDRVVHLNSQTATNEDYIYYPHETRVSRYNAGYSQPSGTTVQGEHTYYGAFNGTYYAANTMDTTEDTIWKLPINENKMSYVYYGEYGSAEEIGNQRADTESNNPRFDFDATDPETAIAPNARSIPTTNEINQAVKPDLFVNEQSNAGYFIESFEADDPESRPYSYELEIIDSQGCATSTRRSITVTKIVAKPIAFCNYEYHYLYDEEQSYTGDIEVPLANAEEEPIYGENGEIIGYDYPLDQTQTDLNILKNYQYYGGKMIQSVATVQDPEYAGQGDYLLGYILPTVIENGDNLDKYETDRWYANTEHTLINYPRESPIFMFNPLSYSYEKRDGEIKHLYTNYSSDSNINTFEQRGEDTKYFLSPVGKYEIDNAEYPALSTLYNKDKENANGIEQGNLYDPEYYNPRIAQMLTGENLSEFINAKNTTWKDDVKLQSSDDTTLEAQWKVYPARIKDATHSWSSPEDVLTDENLKVLTDQTTSEVLGTTEFVNVIIGAELEKTSETPICTSTGPIEDGPDCVLNTQGYYIVELTVKDTAGGNDPDAISDPINCKVKVKIPKLDFKCPWGETVRELEEHAFEFERNGTNSEVILDEYGQVLETLTATATDVKETFGDAKFIGSDRIDKIEITPYLYNDPNRFDEIEKNHYGDVIFRFFNEYYTSSEDKYANLELNKLSSQYSNDLTDTICAIKNVENINSNTQKIRYQLVDCDSSDNRQTRYELSDCTYDNQEVCYLFMKKWQTPSLAHAGPSYVNVYNPETRKTENKEIFTYQPLTYIDPQSEELYGNTACYVSTYDEERCIEESALTYPLELWLTKLFITKLGIETDWGNPLSAATFQYTKDQVLNTLYDYSDDEREFATKDFQTREAYDNLRWYLNSNSDLSPVLMRIDAFIDELAEFVALSYYKDSVTWSNLQPTSMDTDSLILNGRRIYSSSLYQFYTENIRENNPDYYPATTYGIDGKTFKTAFYGKKEAILRFEQLNYLDLLNNEQDIGTQTGFSDFNHFQENLEGRKISLYDVWKNEGVFQRDKVAHYFDHKTVWLNVPGLKLTDGWQPVKSSISNGNDLSSISNTGISYSFIPSETLNYTKIHRPGIQTAKSLTKSAITETRTQSSRILYLKVNVFSQGSTNDYLTYALPNGGSKSVPNSHSKLCPIIVRKVPDRIDENICFLRSKNMDDPEPLTGRERKNLFIYDIGPVDTDYSTSGYVSIDAYKAANSQNILTYDGISTDNIYPTFSLDGTFASMIESARAAGAIKMQLDFFMEDSATPNYGSFILDISHVDEYAPTTEQLQKIKSDFEDKITKNGFKTNSIEPIGDTINDGEYKTYPMTRIRSTAEECASHLFNNKTWYEYSNYLEGNIDENQLSFTYEAPYCIISHTISNNDVHNGLHKLKYNISFKKLNEIGNEEVVKIGDSEMDIKTCEMWTAHSIEHNPQVQSVSARIWLGKVYDRIQYITEDKIPHSDYSVDRNGKRKRGNGVYQDGTICDWKIAPSGFSYKGSKRQYDDYDSGTYYGGDGLPYTYISANTRIQDYCIPVINGVVTETPVDIRSLAYYDWTGFVTQEIQIRQDQSSKNANQKCYKGQSGTNHNGESICRAATMYGVTTGKGSPGEAILSNLTGTDVFLALEKQNGGWSEIIENGVAIDGKIWVGPYIRRN